MIWAQTVGFGVHSNMVAETKALLLGVKRCLAEGYIHVDLEMDSLILKHILKKEVVIPWSMIHEVRELWRYFDQMDVAIMHAYREINQVADGLANIGCKVQKKVNFSFFSELPHRLKGVVNLDRMGMSVLRWKRCNS